MRRWRAAGANAATMDESPRLDYQSKADFKKEAGFLATVFGPGHELMWRRFAEQFGSQLEGGAGGLFPKPRVSVKAGPWTFELDVMWSGENALTRMRTAYVNPSRFRFALSPEGLLSRIGKLLGMEDIRVGDEALDREFVVKSNQPQRVRQLLADGELRRLLHEQPAFEMIVRDTDRFAGPNFTRPIDELTYRTRGVVRELKVLHDIYDLLARTMEVLRTMGLAQA
jgi:hypothetical protein